MLKQIFRKHFTLVLNIHKSRKRELKTRPKYIVYYESIKRELKIKSIEMKAFFISIDFKKKSYVTRH
jgi:hypothetical protein